MEKKYKLTEESIIYFGRTLYRIEALKDFGNVKKGDKGGYVEKEDNLSQEGNCWIYGYAQVKGNAQVYGNAIVRSDTQVYGNAEVFGNAIVYDSARVYDNAKVYDDARVYGNSEVFGNAEVSGYAVVSDNVEVSGKAKVFGNAKVYDSTVVCNNAQVYGNAEICSNAEIKNSSDYIVFKNCWSSGRYFTWTRSNNMWKVGCFYGTGEELIAKAYKDSELSGREYERVVNYVEAIIRQ